MEKKANGNVYSAVFKNSKYFVIKVQLTFLYILAFVILMNLYITSQNLKSITTMTENIKQQMNILKNKAKIPGMQLEMRPSSGLEGESSIEDLKYGIVARKIEKMQSNGIENTDMKDLDAYGDSEIKFRIDNYEICGENLGQSGSFNILILIESSHDNTRQRDALRETWLKHAKNNTAKEIRYVFVLETSSSDLVNQVISNESLIHRDIIQGGATYGNRSAMTKTRIALYWAGTRCPDAKYVLKTNDGVYASISNLIRKVDRYNETLETSIGVSCTPDSKPQLLQKFDLDIDRKSKCVYSTFTTSASIAIQIINIPGISWEFKNEAEFIAFCVRKLNLKQLHISDFITRTLYIKMCHKKSKSQALYNNVSILDIYKMWNTKC